MKTRIKPMCGFLIMVTVLGFVTIAHAGDKMEICHVPPDDPDNYHTINVSDKALAGHVRHGDKFMEPCDADCDTICGDENMCTQDYDPTVGCAIGGCYPEPIPLPPGSCDDGNLCTVDSCDALEGCKNVDVICDVNASCNPDTGECESSSKIIFITSETYTGNLGGLAGADVECNSLAEAAELSGTYKAWLSTPTVSAADRLTHSEVPYVLPDGTRVADDWIDFTDGALAHAIDMTDTGATISLPTLAWTNTMSDGSPNGRQGMSETCFEWTTDEGKVTQDYTITGFAGAPAYWREPEWSALVYRPCDSLNRLYCIQQ